MICLFVLVNKLHYNNSCLASVFYTAAVILDSKDAHVGSKMNAAAFVIGPLWFGSITAGCMVSRNHRPVLTDCSTRRYGIQLMHLVAGAACCIIYHRCKLFGTRRSRLLVWLLVCCTLILSCICPCPLECCAALNCAEYRANYVLDHTDKCLLGVLLQINIACARKVAFTGLLCSY